MLKPGEKMPTFRLDDQNGNAVSSEDLKGKKVLIYFYPKADTPGCTKQACSVRDAREDLTGLNVAAVGISPDASAAQKKFEKKYELNFPLLADTEHRVADAFGTWPEKSMYGKKYMAIIRSSFLVGPNGRVIEAWYKVTPKDTVPKAMKAIEKNQS